MVHRSRGYTRVHLWGEVWEFDKGYHGQFCKIVSLDWPKPRQIVTRWRDFEADALRAKCEMVDPLADLRPIYCPESRLNPAPD